MLLKRYLLLLTISLFLVACGNEEAASEDVNETTGSETEEDVAKLEKENEELKQQKLEEENEKLKKELEEQENEDAEGASEESKNEDNKESDNKGKKETDNEQPKESDDQSSNTQASKSDLIFDLSSQEVQSQFIGTTDGNKDGTFDQNTITKGMSQTEVEEMYGPYDFTLYAGGSSPAFYGNLAVVYSEYAPYGNGNDTSESGINPDKNLVESVYYYAGITESELIDALGQPDENVNGDQSMNGLPYYVYQGEGNDGKYYVTGASTFETPEGNKIGLIKRDILDEKPEDAGTAPGTDRYFDEDVHTSGFPVTLTKSDDYYIYDTLTNFTNDYIYALVAYYNNESDDVLNYISGNALEKINANKATGNFSDHQNYYTEMTSIVQSDVNEYHVTLDRTYSHATSDGESTSSVTYTVIDNGVLQVVDYK